MVAAIALVFIGVGLALIAFRVPMGAPFRLLLAVIGAICFGLGAMTVAGVGAPQPPSSPAAADTSALAPAPNAPSAPTVAEPAQPPEPGVGQIVSQEYLDVAVAGGKYLKVGKSRYLALKIYVKNKGTTTMLFDDSMSVEDDTGESWEQDLQALDRTTLQPLDTVSYNLGDGESTAGWVAFELDADTVPTYLVIGDDNTESDFDPVRISLEGFGKVPAGNEAAVAFAKAAKVGGKRVDAAALTMAEYKQVKAGMSRKKVNSIVGFAGDEMSRYGSYTSYSWQNDDGSNMIVTFHSNRAQSKAQAGL